MKISDKGLAFVARHEGFVSEAYKDPVGVLTIGYGFTMGSRTFADFWRQAHGRQLLMGDRISRREADKLLRAMIDEEYGAAVIKALGNLPQHQHDAACSVAFNLGPRSLGWRWARALKDGDLEGAAATLAANYNTAGGRRLAGLVRRRQEEARLLLTGDYGDGSMPANDIANDAGLLRKLGYSTDNFPAAVRAFQRDNSPPLKIDGIFGRASRSTAQRLLQAQKMKTAVKVGVPSAGIGTAIVDEAVGVDWTTIALGLGTAGAVAVLVFIAWVNRGRIWAAIPEGVRDRISSLFTGD